VKKGRLRKWSKVGEMKAEKKGRLGKWKLKREKGREIVSKKRGRSGKGS
jgi:hypothetical protein